MIVSKTKQLQASPVTLLARVQDEDGYYITQAEIEAVSVTVIDLMTDDESLSYLPSVNEVVFNTLQTDSRWTQDSIGYNLAISLDGTHFPNCTTYQVEALLTPHIDAYGVLAPFLIVWQIQTVKTYT